MTLDQMFQMAVNKPTYQLVAEARENLAIVAKYFELFTGKVQSAVIILAAIGSFVAADGYVSPQEYQFMQSVLQSNIDYDAFVKNAQTFSGSGIADEIDTIMDGAPVDVKVAFLVLCLDFIACDGEITSEEQRLLLKYLV